jgi:uncharacterized membrane protein YphA (DoxX/SURF4 family)
VIVSPSKQERQRGKRRRLLGDKRRESRIEIINLARGHWVRPLAASAPALYDSPRLAAAFVLRRLNSLRDELTVLRLLVDLLVRLSLAKAFFAPGMLPSSHLFVQTGWPTIVVQVVGPVLLAAGLWVRPVALLMLGLTLLSQTSGPPQDEHLFWAAQPRRTQYRFFQNGICRINETLRPHPFVKEAPLPQFVMRHKFGHPWDRPPAASGWSWPRSRSPRSCAWRRGWGCDVRLIGCGDTK